MASQNFETECEAFLTCYSTNEALLRDAASSFATLVQLLLSDGENFETPSVESRVKDRDECVSKFKRKRTCKAPLSRCSARWARTIFP